MKDISYLDIHSHLNFPDYDKDREVVIERMKQECIATITIGTSLETSRSGILLAEKYENIYAGLGIHPTNNEEFKESDFEELVKHPKVVTIGECGMDYGREGIIEEGEKIKQKKLFESQIDFAVKWNKPIMIHARNSNSDILDILKSSKKQYGEKLRGNAHFFSGTIEEEKRYFDLDFSVSFTGVITFTNDYDEAVRYAPSEMIMVETDAPFVTPHPNRGRRNDPTNVVYVIKKMAEIRGQDPKKMAEIVLNNAFAKFGLV